MLLRGMSSEGMCIGDAFVGYVILRHVHRRCSYGECHQKARAQAILLRGMSSGGTCIGDALAGCV